MYITWRVTSHGKLVELRSFYQTSDELDDSSRYTDYRSIRTISGWFLTYIGIPDDRDTRFPVDTRFSDSFRFIPDTFDRFLDSGPFRILCISNIFPEKISYSVPRPRCVNKSVFRFFCSFASVCRNGCTLSVLSCTGFPFADVCSYDLYLSFRRSETIRDIGINRKANLFTPTLSAGRRVALGQRSPVLTPLAAPLDTTGCLPIRRPTKGVGHRAILSVILWNVAAMSLGQHA